MKTTIAFALAFTVAFTGIVSNHAEAAKARPDLIVSAVSAPSPASPDATVVVSGTIKNQGKASSKAFNVAYYLSPSTSSTTGAAVLGTQTVSNLSAGASVALSNSFTVPASTTGGTFYVVAVADSTKAIRESNESNNSGTSGAVAVQVPTSAQMTVWVTDSLTRTQPTDSPGTSIAATLKAARNEYESFQVIIRAPVGQGLSNVNVTASDLAGPGLINKSNIALYREHYIQVTTPSPDSPYSPGWWPDALIPFVHPETGQSLSGGRFPAAPFPVSAGQNQPVWVEVFIPEGTPAGTYQGQLTVTANGYEPTVVPLTVTVRNFTLPARSSLRSTFGDIRDLTRFHGVSEGTPEYNEVEQRYATALVKHRVALYNTAASTPDIAEDGSVDTTRSDAAMRFYMDTLGANSWQIPFRKFVPFTDPLGVDRPRALRYLRSLYDYLAVNGWADRAYTFSVDEPGSAQEYQAVRDFASLVHEANPNLKFLLTEPPTPQDPLWGDLYGNVDIWVPGFGSYDSVSAQTRQTLGEEVWSYAAGWQCADCPKWLLDYPAINHRIPLWINWTSHITGLFYWTTTYWPNDPWVDPKTYGSYNGDGSLLYPGDAVGYQGPVTSLRLKAIRDGMEDYEYLKLLADLGDKASANTIAQPIASSFTSWSQNSEDLYAAREQLAQRIIELGGR